MKRYLAFSVLFGALVVSHSSLVLAEDLRGSAPEPFVGKPASAFVPTVAALPSPVPFKLDSTLGKPPAPLVFDGPPPRGGPKVFRFDTTRLFYIYGDAGYGGNHYAPSGWMGDYGDLTVDVSNKEDVADGRTALKIIYDAKGAQGFRWAGMYWQEPANNWGNIKGGFNLNGMKRVTFWARGAKGGEQITEFKIGGIRGSFPDSTQASIGPITLTKDWKWYVIDVSGMDLTKITGGFSWSAGRAENPDGATFYLDEIRFEQ